MSPLEVGIVVVVVVVTVVVVVAKATVTAKNTSFSRSSNSSYYSKEKRKGGGRGGTERGGGKGGGCPTAEGWNCISTFESCLVPPCGREESFHCVVGKRAKAWMIMETSPFFAFHNTDEEE